MRDIITARINLGDPLIHDIRKAKTPAIFRGMPEIGNKACTEGCHECVNICPTDAISLNPVTIDMGKCVFCPLCEETCPDNIIKFTNQAHITCSSREQLLINSTIKSIKPEVASRQIRNYFGKSLKLRQISAGGCNGCELELNASSNVNFDMGRFGIEFVASPRHSDGVVITGPFTSKMAEAADICYNAVPNPKIVILFGACAISGGVFNGSNELDRSFLEKHHIDLYIPGCPPHPLTFINGILDWLERK